MQYRCHSLRRIQLLRPLHLLQLVAEERQHWCGYQQSTADGVRWEEVVVVRGSALVARAG